MRNLLILTTISAALMFLSCTTTSTKHDDVLNQFEVDNSAFLKVNKKSKEVFRVLITSDKYVVSQMKYQSRIQRVEDPGGDKYMVEELKKLDKINEARIGIITLGIAPDTGRIEKIRPEKLTGFVEVETLISEDVQRWNFKFPKKIVYPTKLQIKYRIVLRKKQSDAEIIKEIRQKMKEDQ